MKCSRSAITRSVKKDPRKHYRGRPFDYLFFRGEGDFPKKLQARIFSRKNIQDRVNSNVLFELYMKIKTRQNRHADEKKNQVRKHLPATPPPLKKKKK